MQPEREKKTRCIPWEPLQVQPSEFIVMRLHSRPLSPLHLPHIASSIPPSYAQWRKVRRHKCSLSYSYIMILPCYTMARTHSRPPGAMQLWDHSTWYEDGCVVFHVALQYKRLCKMACMCWKHGCCHLMASLRQKKETMTQDFCLSQRK